jgi:hypothetical protein
MADLTIDVAPILAQISSDVLIEELRRRLSLAATNDGAGTMPSTTSAAPRENGPMGQIRPDEFFRLSTPEAVKKYLSIMKRPQGPKAIVEGLQSGGVLTNARNFYGVVYKEIMRMGKRGELVNTPSGWALSNWYPNKPKQVEVPKAKRKQKKRVPAAVATKALKSGSMLSIGKGERPRRVQAGGDAYHTFISDRRKAGRSLAEANNDWKERNQTEREA